MKAVVRTAVPVALVVLVLGVASVAVFQGVTEPTHRLFGLSSRHADIAACWVLFLGLPIVCALDAARLDVAAWITARRSKFAWIATVAYLPCIGPLLYVTLARPAVAAVERAVRNPSFTPPIAG
jgi:hypothetical protein